MTGSHRPEIEILWDVRVELWGLAILFFGVGDLLTTMVGLVNGPIVETGPMVADFLTRFGVIAIVVSKICLFALCLVLYRFVPSPHHLGVVLGLATLGILVTAWNLWIIGLVTRSRLDLERFGDVVRLEPVSAAPVGRVGLWDPPRDPTGQAVLRTIRGLNVPKAFTHSVRTTDMRTGSTGTDPIGRADRAVVEERELLVLYLLGLAIFFGLLLLLNL